MYCLYISKSFFFLYNCHLNNVFFFSLNIEKNLFIVYLEVLVRIYVTLYRIYWIIFTLDLVLNYSNKFCIPMGKNCAPLVAALLLFCYERDFMTSLSDDNQAVITEAFNSTYRYLDDLLNIDNPNFDGIYPSELQLNKGNTSDTKTPFLD